MECKVKKLDTGMFAVIWYSSDGRALKKLCECHEEYYANLIVLSLKMV